MPIDRRTFVLASGIAAAGCALASFAVVGAVEQESGPVPTGAATPMEVVAAGSWFELRILGWDRRDDLTAFAAPPASDAGWWIEIDQHWRGAWR